MENILQNSVAIPRKLANYIEMLNFETASRFNLIAFMINEEVDNDEMFKKLHDEYQEFFVQFQVAKNMVHDLYVKTNSENATYWELDYAASEVRIYGN